MNWLKEHLEDLREMVEDCFAGIGSKDTVTAGGICRDYHCE